ncbi:MAG: DUF4058 family protein [Roseofilum sp. SBFL]|uniref:DUF4058 family protein n=1 Tax=unclassified Roseofilum TaxID=2620099 RepID=UPI001B05E2F7|nr:MULTISPECIES: DUF4058 family protein [unclassified Roseofilum]MBP0012464.1 DUF4058 family protein [Roseofilum sp. SID3]MBP0025140.1 DUF4058 family protein [Roseofilum sp. SID2]MBP0037627.1 DUF4058 family protein [Roseofilum sp. SID1]MBP0041816.1 DUF4058 family protein [Roseofilum sp. SBFL]
MPSPFPGMNPYLEHPELWPGVHHWLIIELARFLSPQLRPQYRVAVEVRVYKTIGQESLLVSIPDLVQNSQTTIKQPTSNVAVARSPTQPQAVEVPLPVTVRQGYLEVREVITKEVVTSIEIISPINKRFRIETRKQYEDKRNKVLGSSTHLVELDLLRKGQPMPMYTSTSSSRTDYRILVSRGDCRPQADLYGFNLQDAIPSFPLPLKPGDREPLVDLQLLLNNVYDQASYDLVVDYRQDPVPPLFLDEDRAWLDSWLREQNLRSLPDLKSD